MACADRGGGRAESAFSSSKYVHKDDRGTGQDPKARDDVDDPPHKVHYDFHRTIIACSWLGAGVVEGCAV